MFSAPSGRYLPYHGHGDKNMRGNSRNIGGNGEVIYQMIGSCLWTITSLGGGRCRAGVTHPISEYTGTCRDQTCGVSKNLNDY